MTGRLLLLLLLGLMSWPSAAELCSPGSEAGVLRRALCRPVRQRRLDETSASGANADRRDDGVALAVTAERRITRSVVKDKKEGGSSKVPSRATKVPAGNRKAEKDKKAPLVDLRLLQENDVALPTTGEETKSSTRQHKAFFVNYPASQRVHQDKAPGARKKPRPKPKQKQKPRRPESDIYYIKLPPAPYSYIPGLGYISQPPRFSASSLAAVGKKRPNAKPASPQDNPFIKLPIDFVSNGKPTAVYQWPQQRPPPPRPSSSSSSGSKDHNHHHQHHHHYNQNSKQQPDSPIIRLNRGPYVFDGRPTSVYVMKRNPARPPIPNLY